MTLKTRASHGVPPTVLVLGTLMREGWRTARAGSSVFEGHVPVEALTPSTNAPSIGWHDLRREHGVGREVLSRLGASGMRLLTGTVLARIFSLAWWVKRKPGRTSDLV